MRAGELNQRITIQYDSSDTPNSYNEQIPIWSDLKTVWASVATTGGGRFYAAQKVNSEVEVLFIIRHRTDIDEDMRISYGGKTYEILRLNPVDGARREIEILAREVQEQ
jgi:SPP1 family predicted phage head-tail adaptor